MSVSSTLGRKLFAQMPPSIVITEPVPRWRAWAKGLLKGVVVILLCAASFYAGVNYGRTPQTVIITDAGAAAPTQAETPAKAAPAPDALAEAVEARSIEGLEIQTLDVTVDHNVPAQLRYEFSVGNEGRLYEGNFELLVLGEREGQTTEWVYPPEAQRQDGAYRMRVGRYLKTGGSLQLPAGLVPRAVAVRLRESSGVRASRGVILSDAQAGGGQGPARPGR